MNGKNYSISNIKQLIDISKNLSSFSTTFSIKTQNPLDEIDVAIVNQQQLDDGIEIKYNTIKGSVTDTFTTSDTIPKNYYMVVKATNRDVNCVISFDTTDTNSRLSSPNINPHQHPAMINPHPQPQPAQHPHPQPAQHPHPQPAMINPNPHPHNHFEPSKNQLVEPFNKTDKQHQKSIFTTVIDFIKNNKLYILIGIIILLVSVLWYKNLLKKFLVYLPFTKKSISIKKDNTISPPISYTMDSVSNEPLPSIKTTPINSTPASPSQELNIDIDIPFPDAPSTDLNDNFLDELRNI